MEVVPPTILLYGSTGQIGQCLKERLPALGHVIIPERKTDGDLENIPALLSYLEVVKPDIIVNAAAYTNVDAAEADAQRATLINTDAPAAMAQYAAAQDALLVHYSTDYVYDGSGQEPWTEEDTPCPINTYGRTKYNGDVAIQNSECRHFIFRTSWIYSSHGENFVRKILQKIHSKTPLRIVSDQIGAPTSAAFIADVTLKVLSEIEKNPALLGLYHVAASGDTSWYSFARALLQELKIMSYDIEPVLTKYFLSAAKRPLNSRLSTDKLHKNFSITSPHWTQTLQHVLKDIE